MNIVDAILFRCKQNPPAAALCAPGAPLGLISYARLETFIHNIGHRALAEGLGAGQTVALHVKDNILHCAILLALARIGVITFSPSSLTFPPMLRVDAIITDAASTATGRPSGTRVLRVDESWTAGTGMPVEDRFVCRGDATARMLLTSGSTGQMKALALSHDMLIHRCVHYATTMGDPFLKCSRYFSDIGLGSEMCVRLLVCALTRGGLFVFPGVTPMDSLQTFNLYNVQVMVASPGGLSGILKFYEESKTFRSGFRVICTTGSALHKSLSDRVRARLCSELIFHYGSGETSTVAAAPGHMVADIPGAVGYPAPGVKVQIVDDQDRPLSPGAEGAIRIASSMTIADYIGDPAQTARSFRNGYFYPGDRGSFTHDGMLVVSGRDSDVLNLGGDKVQPSAIEAVLSAFSALAEVAVFGVPNALGVEELWAAVVPKTALDEPALRSFCEQSLPQTFRPLRFIPVERLPRNENGKIERQKLKQLAGSETSA